MECTTFEQLQEEIEHLREQVNHYQAAYEAEWEVARLAQRHADALYDTIYDQLKWAKALRDIKLVIHEDRSTYGAQLTRIDDIAQKALGDL